MFCFTRLLVWFPVAAVLLLASSFSGCASDYSIVALGNSYGRSYAVAVSKDTYAREDWKAVADHLVRKHSATLIVYEGGVENVREELAKVMPRYTAFVARTEECGRDYIAEVHRLTRQLDDDPWLDTQWGVITGSDASQALRVAQSGGELEIKRALATTGLKDSLFDEYFLLSDANPPGSWAWKKPDGTFLRGNNNLGKNEAVAWAEQFERSPDLIVTSSHGFENGVEMPFGRGIIRAVDGKLYPLTNVKQQKPAKDATPIAESSNPKVYFPVGNCLVGHVNGQHCMVTTLMGPNGVNQMAGYTVNTWFGRGGWDMLNIWQSLPGRNTFSESFFFNQQWMLHDIAALDPKGLDYKIRLGGGEVEIRSHLRDMAAAGLKFDARNIMRGGAKSPDRQLAGLLWDIDTVAFYGDPAWRAVFNFQKEPRFASIGLVSSGSTHTLSVEILDRMAAAQNTAPIGLIFTTRLKNVEIISGQEYEPIVADNFILLLKPQPKANDQEIVVKFRGDPIDRK